jgi:DNA mismatch repair protein MutS
VAELAGLPAKVVARAKELLVTLEGEHRVVPGMPVAVDPTQVDLFRNRETRDEKRETRNAAPKSDPVREDLKAMDLNSLTPIEALNRLADLKRKAGGDQ